MPVKHYRSTLHLNVLTCGYAIHVLCVTTGRQGAGVLVCAKARGDIPGYSHQMNIVHSNYIQSSLTFRGTHTIRSVVCTAHGKVLNLFKMELGPNKSVKTMVNFNQKYSSE